MKIARRENLPLDSQVFEVYYDEKYKLPWKSSWQTEDDYYLEGLRRLQEINPDLEFTHPHNYVQQVEKFMSQEERSFVKQSVENEFEWKINLNGK